MGGPPGQHSEIGDPTVGLGESSRLDRGSQHRHEQARLSNHFLSDRAGGEFYELPSLLLAATARRNGEPANPATVRKLSEPTWQGY